MSIRIGLVAGDAPDILINLTQPGGALDVSPNTIDVVLRTKLLDPAADVVETVCEKLPGFQPRDNSAVDGGGVYVTPGRGGRVVARCSADTFPDAGNYSGDIAIVSSAGGGRTTTVYDRVDITVRASVDSLPLTS